MIALLPRCALLVALAGAIIGCAEAQDQSVSGSSRVPLHQLPANRWVVIDRSTHDWHRQAHAGMAYDSRRGRLLVFGSDTHGYDWDNRVHEFDPVERRWSTHYAAASPDTYRADDRGRAIAGTDALLPWAMHGYDNVVYDPSLDALVVTALPAHNRAALDRVPAALVHPTWIYELGQRTWRIFENAGQRAPTFFAAGSAYDSRRDTVVAYRKWQLWELGPDRREWVLASKTPEPYHEIHFTVDYDSRRGQVAVFGNYRDTSDITIYTPGRSAGEPGTWERRSPGGDEAPRDQHIPVAFDERNGVYLLVIDNNRFETDASGRQRKLKPHSASTFVYDPDQNVYRRLPDGDLDAQGMNYMMAFDQRSGAFLLITGRGPGPVSVLALRLDPTRLP